MGLFSYTPHTFVGVGDYPSAKIQDKVGFEDVLILIYIQCIS